MTVIDSRRPPLSQVVRSKVIDDLRQVPRNEPISGIQLGTLASIIPRLHKDEVSKFFNVLADKNWNLADSNSASITLSNLFTKMANHSDTITQDQPEFMDQFKLF